MPYRARPKGPPFQFFSALRDYFRKIFFPQRAPFIFLLFCVRMDVGNPEGSPLSVFRQCETFFSNFFLSKGSPFNFFDILQQIGCLKIPKGPPFQFFGIDFFFENLFFLQRVPPSTATKMLTISEVSPF